jgi:multidrug transporter EmrE-like cation transporter
MRYKQMMQQAITQTASPGNAVVLTALIASNLLFNIVAQASFKVSANSTSWRGFLLWQIAGNLAGFVTVLTLTGLLRFIPLSVAYPLTVGLAVIGVQVAAARLLFHEPIAPAQWLGTLLIACGVILVCKGK